MDEIEFEEPYYESCSCCGARITRLTRFVTRDGDAFAVYYAKYSNGPEHNDVQILAGFGDWAEDAPEEARTAISFKIWQDDQNFNTTIVGPEDGRWEATILGRKLEREEALTSEWLKEVFDLSNHIVRCDEPIKQFFDGK
jgi:hypothetical protein